MHFQYVFYSDNLLFLRFIKSGDELLHDERFIYILVPIIKYLELKASVKLPFSLTENHFEFPKKKNSKFALIIPSYKETNGMKRIE